MWIRLKNIPIFAFHGAYPHEREFGNKFDVDVEIEANLEQAAEHDTLADTIDYTKVLKCISKTSESRQYNLLEAWGRAIATDITEAFPSVRECIVRIRKHGGAVGGLLDTVEVEYHHAEFRDAR